MDHTIKRVLHAGCDCKRVKLRPLSLLDAEDMFEYTSCAETCKYLKWGPHTSVNQAKAFIEKTLSKYKNPEDIVWGIEEKSLHKLIGVVRIYNITQKEASISYVLNQRFAGKGYMTEAIQETINQCIGMLSLSQVYAYFIDENHASERVMLRCGMKRTNEIIDAVEIKGTRYKLIECITKGEMI